jgi:hypothetical protein
MNFSRCLTYITLSLWMCSSCALQSTSTAPWSDPDLERFAMLLAGKYSSAAQAARDTAFYNISLVMTPIWPNRTDGRWLYVEQAMASKPDKPYRQRVYKLNHPSKMKFTSEIFTIRNAKEVVGLQSDRTKLQLLHPDSIELKDGCAVVLSLKGGIYTGGTRGSSCASDLRGAKYATSIIVLKEGEMVSWDRGYDAEGKQVWGATKGGYVFVKEN